MRLLSFRRLSILGSVFGFALALATPQSKADFVMAIVDSSHSNQGVVVTGAGGDASFSTGGPGGHHFDDLSSLGGAFTKVVAEATTQPLWPLHGAYVSMDLNNLTIASSTAATLTLIVELTNIAGPSSTLNTFVIGAIGGTLTNGSITTNTYLDTSNAFPSLVYSAPGLGVLNSPGTVAIGAIPSSANSVGAWSSDYFANTAHFSDASAAAVTLAAGQQFSLYSVVTLTFGAGGGAASFDLETRVAPEPSTMAMAASCLPLILGLAFRRYRRTHA